MERCEVLIVGGGPAGSSCAWKLRRRGLDAVIWDRAEFPRDKVCAGWITPPILSELEIDPAQYGEGRTFQPITGFRVSRMGDRQAVVEFGAPVSYGIRRCEFDHFLLRRAGVPLRLGKPARRLRRQGDVWVLDDAIAARVVVGAGGHFCPVAVAMGARLGAGEPIVSAQEIEFEMDSEQSRVCRVAADVPELFFTQDLAGYGWVFRKGNYLNVGLGRQDNHRLGERVAQFVAFLTEKGRIPPRIPVKWRGHAYLLYGMAPRPLVADGMLLVGDAAGLAYPRSGEGIRPAIESGLLAAGVLADAGGVYDRGRLESYERVLRERFGRREGEGFGVTSLLPHRLACALAGKLLATRWFARRVVLERWFFRAGQRPLAV